MSTPYRPPIGQHGSRSARPGVAALAGFFDSGSDRNAVERMVLALAVHRDGAGFARAHLLLWNPNRGAFEGRLCWTRARQSRPVDQALAAARTQATEGTDPEATRLLRALLFAPRELSEGLLKLWNGGRSGTLAPDPARLMPWDGAAAIGAVVLRHGQVPYALLMGEWSEAEDSAPRAEQLESLRAVGNAALSAHCARERADRSQARAAALAEFARASVSSLNLAEAGNLLVRLACEGAGARGAALWRADDSGATRHQSLELFAAHGASGSRERLSRGMQPLASACLREGRAMAVDRAVEEAALPPQVAAQITSAALAPLLAYGKGLGVLAIYDRLAGHPNEAEAFDPEDQRFLSALADQCALTFHHALSEDARRQGEQARSDLLQQLSRSEKLAALAESSAQLAQETKNPIASIAAFARRVHRSLAEDDPNREYLEVVVREADRLERSLAGHAKLLAPESPRLRVDSVNALVQRVLRSAGEQLVRRRIRLLKKLAPDIPEMLLDTERMAGALQNMLDHGLERVSPGGRIRVETRKVQQFVVVEIAHDGRGEPGEVMDDLFVPFQLQGGREPGLATARQIILQHGGEVRTRTEGEWSSVFIITFPIRGNQDRRKPGLERRVTRSDRRRRAPAA